jgi:hypothetical protein
MMTRSGYIAILAVLALAVAGCGGGDDSASKTSAGTTGQQGTTGTQTRTKDARPKRIAKPKERSGEENSGNGGTKQTATTPTTPAAPAPENTQPNERVLNSKELKQVRRGLAKQAQVLCKAATLEALAQQYQVAAKPDEVAQAYAAGYPANLRHAVAAGCKQGLLESK